ncbi:MAG: hypothetical protein ABIQ88_17470 [Chitinophagaceae bacterium]
MIAYNNEWLRNLLIRNQADKAHETSCISKTEKEQVYNAYPVGFYTPNIFVRIGLFILTVIIVTFSLGLFSLLFMEHTEQLGILFVFFGLLVYAGLEMMVRNRHYKSGVDDALIWMAAGNIIGGLNATTTILPLVNALLIFAMALFLFLRFTGMVMAAIASLALLAVIFYSLVQLGPITKAIMPFVIMTASALMYFFVQQQLANKKWKQYASGLQSISVTALVCLYAAGNYYIVREASISMFNLSLQPGQDIPFGWLFWLFTVAIPVIYIVRGIQKKDAILLRVGLLLVAAVVFTVRFYYHLLPAEIVMVTGGVVFIGIAYALIKYLHEPKYGFTYKEQQHDSMLMDKLHAESLVIAQTFSGPSLPPDTGTQFGGGTGSGGGASSAY